MSEISIKLKIADREYPMKVAAADEERIRRAGREINERIKQYQERFRLDDKQDLLALVAFDAWIERLKHDAARRENEKLVSEKLADWDTMLAQALQE